MQTVGGLDASLDALQPLQRVASQAELPMPQASLLSSSAAANRVQRAEPVTVVEDGGPILAGGGGKWRTINEVPDSSVVQQATPTSCGQACGQMLLADRGVMLDQARLGGDLTSPQGLANRMNQVDSGWVGAGVDSSSFDALNRTGSWSAMMWERGNGYGHWVVVDGLNDRGMVMIRDPFNASRYEMTPLDFDNAWNGYSVFKPNQ